MNEERKGAMTPDQEKILEKIVKFKNPTLEAVDGLAIQVIDNTAIDAILKEAEEKYPGSTAVTYQVTDLIFAGLAELFK